MFKIFTLFADWVTSLLGLDITTKLGGSVHFFVEDITKIFFLIYVTLFVVSLFRAQLSPERVRAYLSGKNRFIGYFLAAILGVITPFCSCSSIPLFLGFVSAGVPFGITMAFLISSPLVSEVAALLLFTIPQAGPQIAFVYIISGMLIAIVGGYFCDSLNLERFTKKNTVTAPSTAHSHCDSARSCCCKKSKVKGLVKYANDYSLETIRETAPYVVIGLALGAAIHGFVPQEFFIKYLGKENLFAVPLAALAGIPIYANHLSVIPIVQVFLMKGVPVGTALVMLMSITAISLPEMVMLSKVLTWRLIAIFCGFLLCAFIFTGYLLNWIM